LNYADFVGASGREVHRILSDLPLQRSRLSPGAIKEIENSVNPNLRHNATTYDEMIQRADIFGWLRDTYDAHIRLCTDPYDAEAAQALDRVRAQFNLACEAFGPFIRALEQHVAAEAAARQVAENRAGAFDAELARIPAIESELRMARERADRLEGIASRVAPLEQILGDSRAEADRLRGELTCQAALTERLLAEAREEANLLRSDLRAVRREKLRPKGLLWQLVRSVYWAASLQLPHQIRTERLMARRMQLVSQYSLFDGDWYDRAYPDVLAAGVDPLRHFCEFGLYEGRRPGPTANPSSLLALRRKFEDLA
jgi:hypothetical protein